MSKKFDYHLIMIEMSDNDNRFPHKNTVSDNNNGVLIVELFFTRIFPFILFTRMCFDEEKSRILKRKKRIKSHLQRVAHK